MAEEHLAAEEILALADAFPGSFAHTLLSQAGFPAWAVPAAGYANSLEFWSKVAEQVGRGVMRDGRRQLLAAARRQLPYNDSFAVEPGSADAGRAVSVSGSAGVVVGEHNIQVNVFNGQDDPEPEADEKSRQSRRLGVPGGLA